MPHQPTVTEIRMNNIVTCLTSVIPLLKELNHAFGPPFVQAIVNTTASLIPGVQKVKRNRDECVQLMENIHGLLYVVINLHIESETRGSVLPTTLKHIGKFAETLQKIHMYVEVQQEGNKIKHFLRHSEISALFKDCRNGLQQALNVFKMDNTIFSSITEMQKTAETMHQELLELITTLSDGTMSDRSSSIYQYSNGSQNSSNSFSLLPSQPKIFHGRESELEDIVKMLNGESPRIAILGPGGMGKTSLARAALHHQDIAAKYEDRVFIACDSADSSIGIAALIGTHLGLNPGKDLTKPVVWYFSSRSSSLLILDNLETPWEPQESRGDVEELLSLLADIQHLALIITMRGAERPAKVRWSRPFLQPLKPLTDSAAWKTFIDIAEDTHESEDIKQLLQLTDNMPLAVDLIAHLVDSEGCSNVLSRWEMEKTTLLSEGHDRRSSLDASIAMSISSSRMNSVIGAKDLLSLLSILPDGLSDVELLQSNLSIQDVLRCKATLIGTSLAYIDANKRLKSLVPIREHVMQFHPPARHLIDPLRTHFHSLLVLYQNYHGLDHTSMVNQITSNLGNLRHILRRGLHPASPDLLDSIECTILLNSFCRVLGRSWQDLMEVIPDVLPQPCNHRLEVQFIIETFKSWKHHPVPSPDFLVSRVVSLFHNFNDQVLEAKFYGAVADYHRYSKNDQSKAMQFYEKALALARSCGNTHQEAEILNTIAVNMWTSGDYSASLATACDAQKLAQVSADLNEETRALRTRAMCYIDVGDYQQSITLFNKARQMLKLSGLGGGTLELRIMHLEADAYQLKSEYTEARKMLTEILENTSPEQNPSTYGWPALCTAEIDVMTGGGKDHISQELTKLTALFETMQTSGGIIACEITLASLYLRERDYVAAKPLFQKCINLCWGNQEEQVSYSLERLADTSRWGVADFGWSSRWTVVYLVHTKILQKKLDLYKALQFMGDVFLRNGDDDTANNLFIVALQGFTFMDVHRSRANCMIRLGDIAQRRGDFAEAVTLWRNARPLFELSLQTNDVAQIDARLGAANQEH
ncbi:hypothetical protein FB451DRAFT_1100740 [Mycena latifolia]|nr:hypothetical protein FB451DRAFT_1100740 [Mycena latifolia]